MIAEILDKGRLHSRFNIDFERRCLDIIDGPNSDVPFVNRIFMYSDGFKFNYDTVSTYLYNRGITSETSSGSYTNIDDDVELIISR